VFKLITAYISVSVMPECKLDSWFHFSQG